MMLLVLESHKHPVAEAGHLPRSTLLQQLFQCRAHNVFSGNKCRHLFMHRDALFKPLPCTVGTYHRRFALGKKPTNTGSVQLMSQEQSRRAGGLQRMEPGDVYPVHGDPAARVQREEALAGHRDPGEPGLVVTETDLPGQRLITTVSGGQVVSQFAVPAPSEAKGAGDAVTIGQALEAAGMTADDRPVGRADKAAVQAAEVRATGLGGPLPGGLGSAADAAAEANARVGDAAQRAKLGDVLADAAARLPADKAVTREDAERVRAAEERNYEGGEDMEQEEGGVAAAVMAAAGINEARIK
ncbi:hypothetical protein OPV22_007493 [Ensete ventricosum]|uniref:SMP domain-containing protein n=1 Tax=Ensete ventricosum TaxID=4639 RepID=A0AAV8Q7A3_ENSVE|nr:hypothetical protein OPV22_007493 [Ensete ventricosum]